MTPYFYIGWFI